jgi:hypothetical protein
VRALKPEKREDGQSESRGLVDGCGADGRGYRPCRPGRWSWGRESEYRTGRLLKVCGLGQIESGQMIKRPRTEQAARPQRVSVESDLLNRTTSRGKDVIRIGTDEPDRANYEH